MKPEKDRANYAATLAPLLGVTPATSILKRLSVQEGSATRCSAPRCRRSHGPERWSTSQLPGIYTQATTQRQYPATTTAANIVGTVHSNGHRRGRHRSRSTTACSRARTAAETYSVASNVGNGEPEQPADRSTVAARNGATVKLTIDQNLQYMAQ